MEKEIVLVCKEGSKYPFDVQQRTINRYRTESPRDFKQLQAAITGRLIAIK